MREQIVRIVSLDRRYRQSPYPATPAYDSNIDTYITGQHINPNDSSTEGNLTKDEMMGVVKLTAAKRNKFPVVINPKDRLPLMHMRRLNLTKDAVGKYIHPKDGAIYDFAKLQDYVAPSKDEYVTTKHFFYLENKQKEAEIKVTKRDLRFKAERLVRENTASGRMVDIAEMLNYKVKDFNIDTTILFKSQLEAALYDACDKYTQDVIDCYSKGAEEDLFIIKLVKSKIIKKTNDGFYDGSKFIGMTLGDVKMFLNDKENEPYVSKWGKLLIDKEEAKKDKVK